MKVQELIDMLNKVEDKDREICVSCNDGVFAIYKIDEIYGWNDKDDEDPTLCLGVY